MNTSFRAAIVLCLHVALAQHAVAATAPAAAASEKSPTLQEKPRPGRDGVQTLPPNHPLNGIMERSKARAAARAASAPQAAAASAPAKSTAAKAGKPAAAASSPAATASPALAAASAPAAAASAPSLPKIAAPAAPNFVIGGSK
jgi:hypothetical protein